MNDGTKYLRRRDLMQRYKISEATLDRHLKSGELPTPHMRLGNAPLWDQDKLERWEAERAEATA